MRTEFLLMWNLELGTELVGSQCTGLIHIRLTGDQVGCGIDQVIVVPVFLRKSGG